MCIQLVSVQVIHMGIPLLILCMIASSKSVWVKLKSAALYFIVTNSKLFFFHFGSCNIQLEMARDVKVSVNK